MQTHIYKSIRYVYFPFPYIQSTTHCGGRFAGQIPDIQARQAKPQLLKFDGNADRHFLAGKVAGAIRSQP